MSEKKATRVGYGEALQELGAINDKVVVLDADLAHSTQTLKFKEKYPERFFNVGIAEANLIDISAGLSTMGYIPFASTFAMFGAGRAFEQIRNGIAYPHFNVKLAFTHAGLTVGEDGGSHQTIEDIALMRVIPGMTVLVPSDFDEAKKAVKAAAEFEGPVFIRLSRYATPVLGDQPFEIGKANVLRDGSDGVIFACGTMVSPALEAAEILKTEGKEIAVVNIHTIKPLDAETVLTYANKCKKVITAEEHSVIGGLGDAVADVLLGKGSFAFKKIGVQDAFGQSGTPAELMKEYGLTTEDLVKAYKEL